MILTEKKLKAIIKNLLKESNNNDVNLQKFKSTIQLIKSDLFMFMPIEKITVIASDKIQNNDFYAGITDDIHDQLVGNNSNTIYNNFGQIPKVDNIRNDFESEGRYALKEFFDWVAINFEYFDMENDVFIEKDSILIFYRGKDDKEYQVSIIFFN